MRPYFLLILLLAEYGAGQSFTIRTVAGDGVQGFAGDKGPAIKAEIFAIAGIAVDGAGNVYIADTGSSRIRKVLASDGTISTIAGTSLRAYTGDGGPATAASLNFPHGVAVDAAGNVYIADSGNYVIRKIDLNGTITTIAGTGVLGFSGDAGPAMAAQMSDAGGLVFDPAGSLYFADRTNNRIRKITTGGTISTVAGNGISGHTGDGGSALSASLALPNSVALDAAGNIYFAELFNFDVRMVSAKGIISTVAGGALGYGGDGGPATAALLNDPQWAVADGAGNIYISDEDNQRIRMIDTHGIITTIAGDGTKNFSGDGGPASAAEIALPAGLAFGPDGSLYFLDTGNDRVRVLTPVVPLPAVTPGGVVSASAFGEFAAAAPESWIEIYGTNLASGTATWGSANFTGTTAPTALGGTSVTIGGIPAFVEYIDPGHVNAQVPSGIPSGTQPLIVTTKAGASAAYNLAIKTTEPGLLAPASFVVAGTQYVAALFSDGATYVLPPGAIAGVPSRRAKAGDAITFYGVGFGTVTPPIAAGQIVGQANALASPVQIYFAQTAGTMLYQGLAPGSIGLYQFNVTVPAVAASDTVPLTFTQGGVGGAQTLSIAVQ